MGYRCSWVAVHDKPLNELLTALELERTGERFDFSEPGLNAIESRDGWNVVIADGQETMDSLTEANAKQLSKGTRALFFQCNDASMVTLLVEYKDGKEGWSIRYNGTDGVSTPEVFGEVPDVVNQVVAEQSEEQSAEGDDVDCMYDIAPAVGLDITGFRHDQEPDVGEADPIQELRRIGSVPS